jgi:SAM-dependent methyltransferase
VSRRGLFSLGLGRLIPDDEGIAALGSAWRNFEEAERGVERTNYGALRAEAAAAWSAGDYEESAARLAPVAAELVAAADIRPGHAVLDAGAGTGNAALAAAAAGARVTALDISPRMLDEGGRRARDAGVEIDPVLGDVEEMPFPEASFDRVVSNFGAIFAPRPPLVSSELARVTRPGGVIALSAWTSTGFMGRVLDLASKGLPPRQGVSRPARWGRFESAFRWFSGGVVDFEMAHGSLPLEFENAEVVWNSLSGAPGPLRSALEQVEQRRRLELREALLELVEVHAGGRSTGGIAIDASYALISGRKPAPQSPPRAGTSRAGGHRGVRHRRAGY